MSVDPFVHGGSQGINPYSYIMNNPLAGTDPSGYEPEVATKEMMIAATGSNVKHKVTATATKNEDGSATVTFTGKNANAVKSAKMAATDALTNKKFDVKDLGSPQQISQIDDVKVRNGERDGGTSGGLSSDQLSKIYSDTASTIANGAAATFGNLIPDMVNGIAGWTEQFLHQDSGSFGRMEPWIDVDNEVAQGVANDFRKILAVGTAMVPVMRTSTSAGSIQRVNPLNGNKNCVNCVVATDATLAGNSASALGGGPFPIKVLQKYYGGTFTSPTSISRIIAIMDNAGSGARGIVFGSRGNQVGHVFNVVNQKGTIRFLDGQTGKAATLTGYDSFRLLRTN
ncbi:toxin glutamine deamidase domain-containing protein [Aestuariibacter sp. GS-14]|uniref:toxin glutamine deamidase domain-containing protein n=2 Tax=Alteromonadaceae TaxID=72275 RepID=UPI0015E8666D